MRLIESLLANLNRESRLAKYIESAQLYFGLKKIESVKMLPTILKDQDNYKSECQDLLNLY